MVNRSERIKVDPELEDLLTMWGMEITELNLKGFFGVEASKDGKPRGLFFL